MNEVDLKVFKHHFRFTEFVVKNTLSSRGLVQIRSLITEMVMDLWRKDFK